LTPDERERMNALCERIAIEKDQQKFVQLIRELNDLLERKQHRLERATPASKGPAQD
jgi:hypothetical protein